MPGPDVAEFDSIKEIILKAQGLSPASIRYVRARLLEILKAAPLPAEPDEDVKHVQEKTRGIFDKARRIEGE